MTTSKFKRKGKSKFVAIDGYVMKSAAWRSLSPTDRAAYIELKWRYDGHNNGRIGLGCRELAEALHVSKNTAQRSLASLVNRGFSARAKTSGFNVKDRTATQWRLTEYSCDVSHRLPSKDFMRWGLEATSQAHLRDTQSHQRDSGPTDSGQNDADSPTRGTVRAILAGPQAHLRDTYTSTMGGCD